MLHLQALETKIFIRKLGMAVHLKMLINLAR